MDLLFYFEILDELSLSSETIELNSDSHAIPGSSTSIKIRSDNSVWY